MSFLSGFDPFSGAKMLVSGRVFLFESRFPIKLWCLTRIVQVGLLPSSKLQDGRPPDSMLDRTSRDMVEKKPKGKKAAKYR